MEDHTQITPFAPVTIYGRSDEVRKPQKRPSKCLVCVLAFITIAFAIFLILAQIFLRVGTPALALQSVFVRHFRRGNSSDPSFNLTLVNEVSIKNPNLWRFEFRNSTASFMYGVNVLGEMKIGGAEVGPRETKRLTGVQVDLKFKNTENLSGDLGLEFLDLSCHAELKGRVHVLSTRKKRKVAKMRCTMKLNMRRQSMQELSCH